MSSNDSGSESDGDIPEVAVCKRLCEEFAEITGTDTACAQFYLQDRKWNLEQSVNDFFEDRNNKGAVRVNKKKEAEVVVVVDNSNERLAAAATAVLAESALSQSSKGPSSRGPSLHKRPTAHTLRFITWNIDGLDEKNLKLRTKAVCKNIEVEQADVVFLQEVIPESAAYFIEKLPNYHCTFGNDVGYFVGILLKKSTVSFIDSEITEFPNTRMMRNLLKVNVTYNKIPICLITSHLESTAEGAEERKQQLKFAFKDILSAPEKSTVIFAGDLNLRDKELKELGGLPAGIEDMWIACGQRKECAYTFDMLRNDNLIYAGKFKPRCRFDRVYVRHSSPASLKPAFFGLIGIERILPHRCFPSDHWGVLCHFEMEYKSNERLAAAATPFLAESDSGQSSKEPPSFHNRPTAHTLRFITWNIDGLDEKYLKFRTKAVCDIIKVEQADIVFLQEVIPETAEYIIEKLPNYHCIFGKDVGYFVGILVKKSTVSFVDSEITEFPNSKMGRHLLKVNVTYNKVPMCLITSHLESTGAASHERKQQLKIAFKDVLSAPQKSTVIFGGDLNLRDKELKQLGALPSGIEDMWITCGQRKECAYTWDMLRNDNLIFDGEFKPRLRFDRVYVRRSSSASLKPAFLD